MTLITEEGLDKLIELKKEGLPLPETWRDDIEKYYQIKKRGYEIQRDQWLAYKEQAFAIFKKIAIILEIL